MSEEQKEKIESGTHVLIPKTERWIRYASLVGVVVLIFTVGVTWGQSGDRMFKDSEQLNTTVTHADEDSKAYKDVHMTLAEKQAEFVTRREYDLLVKGQDEIKELIRDLEK